MIAMGAGTNHWFHSDQIYRTFLALVMFCGCEGVNGGGWAHYVGQEKVRPLAGWQTLAFALDWVRPPRHQSGTPFFYLATDQWRYERYRADGPRLAAGPGPARRQAHRRRQRARRPAWAGCRRIRASTATPLDLVDEAERAASTPAEHVVARAPGRPAALRLRGPRRARQPSQGDDRVAREPARLLGQGPRVLPQAPAGDAPRTRCAPRSRRPSCARARSTWRERGARGQARPVDHDRLPHDQQRALLRRRAAGGDLVREARPLDAPTCTPSSTPSTRRCRRPGRRRPTGTPSSASPSASPSWPRRTSASAAT